MNALFARLERVSLNANLLMGFSIGLVIAIIIGLSALSSLSRLQADLEQMYDIDLQGISHIKDANLNLIYMSRAMRHMLIAQDDATRDVALATIKRSREKLIIELAEARKRIIREAGIARYDAFQRDLTKALEAIEQAVGMIQREKMNPSAAAQFITSKEFGTLIAAADGGLHELTDQKEKAAEASLHQTREAAANTRNLALGMLLAGVGLAIGLGIVIGRSIQRPNDRLRQAVEDLAAGKVDGAIPCADYPNEVGVMARAIGVLQAIYRQSNDQHWVKTHVSTIGGVLQQAEDFPTLAQAAVSRVAPAINAGHGAFYVAGSEGAYSLLASYGYRERKSLSNSFRIGEGLVGQCVMEKSPILLTAPQNYIRINSGLGEGPPASIIVLPVIHGDRVLGVLEMASFQKFTERERAVLESLLPVLATSMEILDRNLKTRELLAATQEQAERMEKQAAQMEEQTVEMEAQQYEIKAAEERSRQILGSVKDGIVGLDNDGTVTFANAAAHTLLGYPDHEFLGRKLHGLIHHHHPDGSEFPVNECAMYQTSRDGKPRNVADEVLWCKDGTAIPVEYSTTPVFKGEQLIGTVVVYRDISEHKRAEQKIATINERFELVNQATSEGLWDMTVVAGDPVNMANEFWWAEKFRTMLGFSDENDFPNVLGSWANRLHPDDKERTLAAFAAHLNDRSGKTPYDIEYQLQRKDGTYRWYRARGATLRDKNGVPLRVAGSLAEIAGR